MSRKKKKPAPLEALPAVTPVSPGHRKLLLPVAAVVIIAVAAFYLWVIRSHVVSPACCANDNVLLITLDTTRADHLPMYGYKSGHTPNLDLLAGSSVVFEDAVSHVPITLPAHASILTGRLPIAHGMHDNSGYFLDPKETTLAEVLKQNGYTTAAFVSAFVLDSRWQLNQGFDTYYDNFNMAEYQGINGRDIQRRGEETELEASHWLEQNSGKKWFLWVHFYDPHDPYDPPEPYRSEYAQRPYDGEIAYTDEMVGRLLKKVEAIGSGDRTVVALTGDHGESLGEHKEATHGMFLYNATQHVPLLIRVPRTSRKRVPGIVRHIDLAPTILDLLGIQPPAEMQGSSLIKLINGKERSRRVAFSESRYAEIHYGWSPLQSVTTDQYRYVEAPRPELYEWKKDPGESRNLIGEEASIATVLKNTLQEILTKESSGQTKGPQKMDAETEEKLRALGYVGGSSPATADSHKIDPKDKIHLAVALQQASGLSLAGDYPAALRLLLPVLQEDPGMLEAHYIAGIAYGATQQYPQAIDELLKTIRLQPDNITAMYNLALAYQATGDVASSEYWFNKVLQQDPDHISAISGLAALYQQTKQPQRAFPYLQKALKFYDESLKKTNSDKARASLYASAAELYFIGGDLQKAAAGLVAAIELDPKKPMMHYNLAQVYEAVGDSDRAMQEYARETEVDPSNFRAFYNLGTYYAERKNYADAARCFEQATRLNPTDPRGFMMLASMYQKTGRNQEAQQILQSIHR